MKEMVLVRIDKELKKKAQIHCLKTEISLAKLVEELLERFLKNK